MNAMPNPQNQVSAAANVTLRVVTRETFRAICALEVSPEQADYVAPNVFSLAEASFNPDAWVRAIYADDTPVGFVMLHDSPEGRGYFVWRLMIAGHYQRLGFARRALGQVVDYVRGRPGATELTLGYVPGEYGPKAFYEHMGFRETGRQEGVQREMRFPLV